MERLKTLVKGRVILPSDPSYDEARRVWNGVIDKRPLAIVKCKDEEDVVNTVNYARENSLLLAIRGGGHSVAGFGTCDNGVVLDLSEMKKIVVDPSSKTAVAQPGLTWGEFDRATQEHALATTGGVISTTGIAGFTLGGGVGWLVRKHGLTIDNLLSVELVTAEGKKVKASAEQNQDLFWGVKGGGGNFGVVTRFEYKLHQVGPVVFGGLLIFPFERAEEVLKVYGEWVRSVPDELSALSLFLIAPPIPPIPQHIQGKRVFAIGLCYADDLEEGARLVSPIKALNPAADLAGPIPYTVLQSMFDASAPRGINAYWKSLYLDELDKNVIGTLIQAGSSFRSPFTHLDLIYLEGAVKRKGAEESAFQHRDKRFLVHMNGNWMNKQEETENINRVRHTWETLSRYTQEAYYLNFTGEEGVDKVKAIYGKAYPKLQELKRKYDPTNLFRVNQNIKP